MASSETRPEDFQAAADTLFSLTPQGSNRRLLPLAREGQALSIRDALLSPYETVSAKASLGRVCASPAVSCPPAIPIVVSGEIIGPEALELFQYYGVEQVNVVK